VKVMHFPFCYDPDPPGGTELYVRALALELRTMGVTNVICAPGAHEAHYERDGLPVWRFAANTAPGDLRILYGEGDVAAASQVGRIIGVEQPDIVHLHALTSGVSLKILRQARRHDCRLVFTYHTPTVSCLQGTLLREGARSCDGCMRTARCTRCLAAGRGAGPALARVLGWLPPSAGRVLGALGLRGRPGTALRCSELVALRHRTVRRFLQETDAIVAVCGWAVRLLERNGVPAGKLTLNRHGVAAVRSTAPERALERRDPNVRLRVAFLGRLHPAKGAHDLVAAFRGAPQLKATLDFYGIPQDGAGEGYARQIRAEANGDSRMVFRGQLEPAEVVDVLGRYDLLAVPSRTFETGPMVVLEAFAAGTPVIGWNIAGVNELVGHEVNGLLVDLPAIQGWISALHRCADEPWLLPRLRRGVCAPRSMKQVALEMLALYRTLK